MNGRGHQAQGLLRLTWVVDSYLALLSISSQAHAPVRDPPHDVRNHRFELLVNFKASTSNTQQRTSSPRPSSWLKLSSQCARASRTRSQCHHKQPFQIASYTCTPCRAPHAVGRRGLKSLEFMRPTPASEAVQRNTHAARQQALYPQILKTDQVRVMQLHQRDTTVMTQTSKRASCLILDKRGPGCVQTIAILASVTRSYSRDWLMPLARRRASIVSYP